MPRKSKDEVLNKLNEETAKVTKATNSTRKSNKVAKKDEKSVENVKKATKKIGTSKDSSKKNVTKKVETAKVSSKKSVTKKAETIKKSNSKKTVSPKATKKATKKSSKNVDMPLEYYDLPSTYNKTVVKILAQTPSCLFVYWEISNKDSENLLEQYGKSFFENTKPYLLIINETMNYSFEVKINDYANSWYIHINDSNCKYVVKLIRKPINNTITNITYSVNISSSNEMDAPNDHILFDKLGKTVFFRNVKTNIVSKKDISTLSFISNIGRIYNIYDLYKQIYKNELYGDELGFGLSSSQFSSTFK